ncbi:hypothetical protein FGO68_gene6989 [Halteria grandinella]|uniref:Uncharacterized protein n=1 Tax=Halteria grandinella TaxID=5974 RepID=A0A8J8NFT5_HALGN|nr:hypothetical protein FGO68_gene6989 [Halteria grandinella]
MFKQVKQDSSSMYAQFYCQFFNKGVLLKEFLNLFKCYRIIYRQCCHRLREIIEQFFIDFTHIIQCLKCLAFFENASQIFVSCFKFFQITKSTNDFKVSRRDISSYSQYSQLG